MQTIDEVRAINTALKDASRAQQRIAEILTNLEDCLERLKEKRRDRSRENAKP